MNPARNHLRGLAKHDLRPRRSLCIHGTRPVHEHNSGPHHNPVHNTTNQSNAVLSHGRTSLQRRYRACSALCCFLQAQRPTRQLYRCPNHSGVFCRFRYLSCSSGDRRLRGPSSSATGERVQHLLGDQLLGPVDVAVGSIRLVLPHGNQDKNIVNLAQADSNAPRECIVHKCDQIHVHKHGNPNLSMK